MDCRGACAFFTCLAASCSSTGSVAPPLLVGQWREVSDSGGAQFMFFDSDGTCGEGSMGPRGQSYCQACTYRYEGGSIYVTANHAVNNVPVTLTYDTLTIRNMGIYPDVVYARESSVPSGRCP